MEKWWNLCKCLNLVDQAKSKAIKTIFIVKEGRDQLGTLHICDHKFENYHQ